MAINGAIGVYKMQEIVLNMVKEVRGNIDTPASRELHSLDSAKMMSPTDGAQLCLSHTQQRSTAWSQELDLRPQSENF